MKQSRRSVVAATGSVILFLTAGCLGDDGDEEDHDDIPDDQAALADTFLTLIEESFAVDGWRFADRFIPEFFSENDPESDIPILAEAYADIVAEGFGYRAMPTALDDSGSITYMVYIEPGWAASYSADNIDMDEYAANIEETIH